MRKVVLGCVGDPDRAGDGQDFGHVAGAAAATIFAVDDITNVVATIFNQPVRADDLTKSAGVGIFGGQTGEVIRPSARCFGRGGVHALDAKDLGYARKGLEEGDSGGGAQVDATDET